MSKNHKPTQFYATMSTSIVLILISLFLLIFFHSNNITNIVKENINILVELKDNMPKAEIESIQKVISKYEGVIPSSVSFIPKAEALKMMSKELSISQIAENNPFKDLVKFNLRNESYSEERIKEIKAQVELEKSVIGLYYESESVDMVKSNLQKMSIGILVLALCFVALALAIIYNTVKLTLYNDMKLIQTMQVVGAENFFIKKPYLRDAFWMSTKAVIAVMIFMALLCTYLIQSDHMLAEIIQWKYVGLTIGLCFISAFFIQFFTTNSILNRFLSQENL